MVCFHTPGLCQQINFCIFPLMIHSAIKIEIMKKENIDSHTLIAGKA
jgi:hypothetical protein